MKNEMINKIGNYLREQIEDFDVRVGMALNTMDKMRCSFDYADCIIMQIVICMMSVTTKLRSGERYDIRIHCRC